MRDYEDIIRIGSTRKEHNRYPTGILSLDIALGHADGLPGSNLVQLLGAPSSGKTTVAYMWLAAAQASGTIREVHIKTKDVDFLCNAVIVDNEASYDPEYAESLGVDTSKVLVVESETVERSFDLGLEMLKQGVQFLIVDSVNASVPAAEFEKSFEDNQKMAATASLMDRLCKRLTLLARTKDALCILVNQYRANMSPMARSDKKAGGGWSLQYFSKVIIEFAAIKNADDYVEIQATVSKNKTAPARKKTEFRLDRGVGVRTDRDILTLAINLGIVEGSKTWLSYEGKKVQGIEKACLYFPLDEIEVKVREQFEKALIMLQDTEMEEEVEKA